MAPEEVYSLLALRLRLDRGRLLASGQRAERPNDPIYVSWYATSAAEGQIAIADGLAHVRNAPQLTCHNIPEAAPADLGDFYQWNDRALQMGPQMLAMSMPMGKTLVESEPKPVEAKDYRGAIAVFWILPPDTKVAVRWKLGDLPGETADEIKRINREGFDRLLLTRSGGFRYDVALSYAGEDRAYVEHVATLLREAGVTVFYDGFEEAALWGKNLYAHLSDVYGKQARYTVMFISQHYAKKVWTTHERESAQERALQENSEYILPARFDDTPVPGLSSTVGYLSLEGRDPENLAGLIVQKLRS